MTGCFGEERLMVDYEERPFPSLDYRSHGLEDGAWGVVYRSR
jgi:hypothetical protein